MNDNQLYKSQDGYLFQRCKNNAFSSNINMVMKNGEIYFVTPGDNMLAPFY